MKWFAMIVLAIAIAAAVASGLPFASGQAGGGEASWFIDVKLAAVPQARATRVASHLVSWAGRHT